VDMKEIKFHLGIKPLKYGKKILKKSKIKIQIIF
jgi:hypothetical protein